MASPVTPAQFKSIPDAIIEDCTEHWRICFKPDRRGVIVNGPQLVSKAELLSSHPHLVNTWEAQREEEETGAQRIKRNYIKYARLFGDDDQSLPAPEPPEVGVACDQRLLPGMKRHWGELESCTRHPPQQGIFRVCTGCRVGHQLQVTTSDDQGRVAVRGARVFVCPACAIRALTKYGVGYKGCVCDSEWSCYSCRQNELAELSKARERTDTEEKCGRCLQSTELVDDVEVCLRCRKWRTYA